MIPVKQTQLHNPPEQNGNCFAAVIASILEIPIEEVLAVHDLYHREDWSTQLFYWLRNRGYNWRSAPEFKSFFVEGYLTDYVKLSDLKDKYYLVTGMTNRFNGTVGHVCIFRNGEMVHDPHPDNTGLTTLEYFEVIEKINL